MRNLLILILVQIPFSLLGQQEDVFKHCLYDGWSLTMSYNVCTQSDTIGFIRFVEKDYYQIYESQYTLHFKTLDTSISYSPDTGNLVRFWFIDTNGHKVRIDLTNYEFYYNAKEVFEELNRQIWETISKWRFYITDLPKPDWPLEPEPKNIDIDIRIIINCTKP